jgi:hypothetical protein
LCTWGLRPETPRNRPTLGTSDAPRCVLPPLAIQKV